MRVETFESKTAKQQPSPAFASHLLALSLKGIPSVLGKFPDKKTTSFSVYRWVLEWSSKQQQNPKRGERRKQKNIENQVCPNVSMVGWDSFVKVFMEDHTLRP